MAWELNSDRPIYAQIIDKIKVDIVSGIYQAGDKIPSVRELAAEAAVNPNTMQKALSELEKSGLVYSQRTSGRFITEDKAMIQTINNQLAIEQITEFFIKMEKLGYRKEDIITLVNQALQEEKNE